MKPKLDLVVVTPAMLTYHAPYDRTQRRLLTLLNPTSNPLIYKIKTNEQNYYTVTPVCGLLEPFASCEVEINLNSCTLEGSRRHSHRFCVQCIPAPEERPEDLLDAFKNVRRGTLYSHRVPVSLEVNEADENDLQGSSGQTNDQVGRNLSLGLASSQGKRFNRLFLALLVLAGIVLLYACFQRQWISNAGNKIPEITPTPVQHGKKIKA